MPFDVLEKSPCLCDTPKNGIFPRTIGPLDALDGVFGVCGIPLGIAGGDIVAGKLTFDGIDTSSCFCCLPKSETGTPGNVLRGGVGPELG